MYTRVINVCPKCHNVDLKDRDWVYAGKYNSTKFCRYCYTAVDSYKEGWLSKEYIERQQKEHEDWLEEQFNKYTERRFYNGSNS